MRQAQGFLTESGEFFATLEEAEMAEAARDLLDAFTSFVGPGKRVNFDRWTNVLNNLKPEIRRYFDANEALERAEEATRQRELEQGQQDREHAGLEIDTADDGLGQAFEGNEQLPIGGLGAVSDVGTGALAEEIRNLGEEHGIGDGGSDAQGLRSGEDMATVEASETEGPRRRDREKDIRDEVGPDTVGY